MEDIAWARERAIRSRRRLLPIPLLVALLGGGGWALYGVLRPPRALAEMAPRSVLLYLEVSDPKRLLDGIRTTHVGQDLWPHVRQALDWAQASSEGTQRHLAHEIGRMRSPMALMVAGWEWEEDRLRPHLAVMWKMGRSPAVLRRLAEEQLAGLARRVYGEVVVERSEYEGVPILGYRARASSERARGFFCGAYEGTLIVATHAELIRAIVETSRGHRPSVASQLRSSGVRDVLSGPKPPLWGWVSTEALARRAPQIAGGASSAARQIAEALFSAFSFTLAFSTDFEQGQVITRYALDLDPTWEDPLRAVLQPRPPDPEWALLRLIPARSHHFSIYRWSDSRQMAQMASEMLRTQLPQPAALLIEGVLAGMRRALGLEPEETIADALGSELAVVDTREAIREASPQATSEETPLLLIVRVHNTLKVAALVGKHLRRLGGRVREIPHGETSLFFSEARPDRAFAFVQGYLLVGHPEQIEQVLRARREKATAHEDVRLRAEVLARASESFEISVTRDHASEVRTLQRLFVRLGRADVAEMMLRAASGWPPAFRHSVCRRQMIWSESRSPLGSFSLLLELVGEEDEDRP